jgi:preprotein translocase subunit SecG
MDLIQTLLYIIFVISAIVLIVVILLQEGRGGGFGQALGEHGQQTFGVGAKGINRFTFYTAGFFILSAVALHYLNRTEGSRSVMDATISPADPTQSGQPK